MTNEHQRNPSIHPIKRADGYVEVPLDRCLRCFTLHDEEKGYCYNCGNTSGYSFRVTDLHDLTKVRCAYHPGVKSTNICGQCGEPLCESCIGQPAYSFLSGRPFITCNKCMITMKNIYSEYLKIMESKMCCSKHPAIRSVAKCIECRIPICEACGYSITTGVFIKKTAGPYCLTCHNSTLSIRRR